MTALHVSDGDVAKVLAVVREGAFKRDQLERLRDDALALVVAIEHRLAAELNKRTPRTFGGGT